MRTLPAFLDFQMLFLWGGARHFFGGLFIRFFLVLRKNAHTPAIYHHFVTFGAVFVHVCALCVAYFPFFGAHGTLTGHFSHNLAHFSWAWGRKARM